MTATCRAANCIFLVYLTVHVVCILCHFKFRNVNMQHNVGYYTSDDRV